MTMLSYMMGVKEIEDSELADLNIGIEQDGENRKLTIPDNKLDDYLYLMKQKLSPGFWNEVVSAEGITFIFKFKDGSTREYELNSDTEIEIDDLCEKFSGQSFGSEHNVYKWLAKNSFYRNFMNKHYADEINR